MFDIATHFAVGADDTVNGYCEWVVLTLGTLRVLVLTGKGKSQITNGRYLPVLFNFPLTPLRCFPGPLPTLRK